MTTVKWKKGTGDSMAYIGERERLTQNRVITFFKDQLQYTYLGNRQGCENSNIMREHLYANLVRRGYTTAIAKKAIDLLERTAGDLREGLYAVNKKIYALLKYGAKVRQKAGGTERTVYFIDFTDPAQNDFAVAQEVTVAGGRTKRPDVVVYVNGIALAVLELKKSTVSVFDGIRQNLISQKANFIQQFFTTVQFCMAGNESEGLRYGTLLTPEEHYQEWKEDGYEAFADEQDAVDLRIQDASRNIREKLFFGLFSLFYKDRFLDLIHNFIIFDRGVKKVCRYNQYYAVKRAQNRLTKKGTGGIIWHTQGSGKSLTMVLLSKWILARDPSARVLIITDRTELDEQIELTYKGVDENIVRAKNGAELLQRLNRWEDRLLCSLIHKFGRRGREDPDLDYDTYIAELYAALPDNFLAKGNVFVFVDECHRTQSGKLHTAMKAILPGAVFIGFTGTPLLKRDRKTSPQVFGGYIHTYKYNEGVQDGVILDLRYEARDIPQYLTSQKRIDMWFDAKTKGITPRAKARLRARWGNMQKVFSSRSRLEKIASDIILDFATKPRLVDGNGNAMLVAGSVYAACKFYEIFQSRGFFNCAIVSSYKPSPGDLLQDFGSDKEKKENVEKYQIYSRMLDGRSPEDFEALVRRKFVEEPASMQLLIVVDKLLTGFDAPSCTYLYLDKTMHDHALFQAICRVNRLDGESKDFGYIVDYKHLFGNLTDAVRRYTDGAFADYDAKDVEGLLKDQNLAAKAHFLETLEALDRLCSGVAPPMTQMNYIQFFCGEQGVNPQIDEAYAKIREQLYRLAGRLARSYAQLKPRLEEVGFSSGQRQKLEERVGFYLALRGEIGRASGDFIDLKMYEPGMRYLIDNYIAAGEAQSIGSSRDFDLLDFIAAWEEKLKNELDRSVRESAATTMESNIRKKVLERMVTNPAYYEKMSTVLELLIADRRRGVVAYKALMERYIALAKDIAKPQENEHYPDAVRNSGAMRALYDNCGEDVELAARLHAAVLETKQDGFRGNPVKENRIKRALYKILQDEDQVEQVYKIIVEQEEY